MTDSMAMAEIYRLLHRKEWNADTLDAIAEVVERTGRPIEPPVSEGPWCHGATADAHHIAVPKEQT